MIERSTDSKRFNEIINHPSVHPWVCGGLERLDASELVSDPSNVLLLAQHGAFLQIRIGEGTYEVHTQFLPEGRGEALSAGAIAMAYMFNHTDCHTLTTMVPRDNRVARLLTLRSGFEFVKTDGVFRSHGADVPLDHYALTRKRWICQ